MIRTVRSHWQGALLVCGKCSKRVGGGFGPKGKTSLAKLLRQEGVGGKNRKAALGIVETGCLKLCPKKAVVVVDTRSPEDWLLVAPGTPTPDVLQALAPRAIEPLSTPDEQAPA